MPANPPTTAPTKAVTRISNADDPPRGNSCAILCERMFSFLTSIQKASSPHKKKIPRKPDRKPRPMFDVKKKATKKAIRAILHHGNISPAIKAITAVSKVANKNLIVVKSGVSKCKFSDYAFIRGFSFFHHPKCVIL